MSTIILFWRPVVDLSMQPLVLHLVDQLIYSFAIHLLYANQLMWHPVSIFEMQL